MGRPAPLQIAVPAGRIDAPASGCCKEKRPGAVCGPFSPVRAPRPEIAAATIVAIAVGAERAPGEGGVTLGSQARWWSRVKVEWEMSGIANPREMENDMEQLVMLGQFFGGFGLFLMGVGAVWFVSVYKPKD